MNKFTRLSSGSETKSVCILVLVIVSLLAPFGGGDPFDVFRWLDILLRSGSGGYGEVVDYEIYSD